MESKRMTSVEIEQAAAVWLARRDRSDWSEADEAQFTRWLQASTAHRVAFVRLETMWSTANRLKALGAGVRHGVVPAPGEWHRSAFLHKRSDDTRSSDGLEESFEDPPMAAAQRSWRSLPRVRGLAAAVLVATTLSVGWYLWPAGPAYRTPVGSVEAVALSDGSNVTLNTNSEIRVSMTDTERRIELKRGEAFFEVAKDPQRPFIVVAGDQRVVAVGTKFSVRRAESGANEVRVVVTEGRVRIGPAAGGVGPELPAAEVAAGSIARSGGAGVLLDAKPARPVEEYLSWRSGYLMFRDTALADAIAEFNRYNSTKLVIEDRAIAEIQIGGNFRATNVDAFVRLLEDGFPIRVERHGDEIVLMAN